MSIVVNKGQKQPIELTKEQNATRRRGRLNRVMPQRRVAFQNPKSFTVRDLPVGERPRERLAEHGAQALSSAEQEE